MSRRKVDESQSLTDAIVLANSFRQRMLACSDRLDLLEGQFAETPTSAWGEELWRERLEGLAIGNALLLLYDAIDEIERDRRALTPSGWLGARAAFALPVANGYSKQHGASRATQRLR